jgi:phage shock protein A
MAEQINQLEAEAEAGAELAEEYSGDVLKHKFSKLEATSGADADLEALKRQMGLIPDAEVAPVRVEAEAESDEELSEEEMVELEAALAELKAREA